MTPLAADAATFHREFESSLENVSEVVHDLAEFCLAAIGAGHPGKRGVDELELSVCEALTNVVRHAYEGGEAGSIAVSCEKQGDGFVVHLRDQGKPMPQSLLEAREMPATNNDLFDLPEGGMGVALMLDMMDEVAYERVDGTNRLTLKKSVA